VQGGAYAGHQAPSPDGHEHRTADSHLFDQLQADGPLTGDHIRVVERRYVVGTTLGRIVPGGGDGIVHISRFEADVGPVSPGGLHLG
jgi:hypothetical protein